MPMAAHVTVKDCKDSVNKTVEVEAVPNMSAWRNYHKPVSVFYMLSKRYAVSCDCMRIYKLNNALNRKM